MLQPLTNTPASHGEEEGSEGKLGLNNI